jgi:hypothetical protein
MALSESVIMTNNRLEKASPGSMGHRKWIAENIIEGVLCGCLEACYGTVTNRSVQD